MATPNIKPVDPGDEEDIALMRRVADGDEHAFRRLIERHQNVIVGTLTRMVGDPTEAEDLAQRTFLRVWKHAKRWQPTAKFTTYLFTIARNLAYNESRRRSRKKEVSAEGLMEKAGVEPVAEARTEPDAEVERNEMHSEISRVIATLPEKQRMAIILYAYESMSYEEIAQILNISIASVKSLIFRARTTLRKDLGHYLGY